MNTERYDSFEALVADIGGEALETIRDNSKFYTISTLTGSRNAFRERCSVILSEVTFPDLLKLISEADCGQWTTPEHAGTLARAVRYAVIDQIDAAHTSKRIDLCFDWATGNFLSTLERCAEAAGKVVSVRQSRDVASAGESIGRFLARVRHDAKIVQQDDLLSFLEARSMMFRPVVNDQWADWEAFRRIGIDRPYLFELMTLVTNYVNLCNTDRKRFLKLVADELQTETARRSKPARA